MALDIGTLVGHLGIDTDKWDQGLAQGKGKLKAFGAAAGPLLATAGAAAGALLVAGISKAMDVQAANAKLAGQLGLTKDESARIGKAAGQLYADNYGDSLENVNEAIASVVQNIDGMRTASNSDLQDVSAKVLDVAGTFDQDLGGVTKAIGQLMRTGLAKDATQALDIITYGLQNIPGAGEDLLDTLNEYDVQFQALGLTGPQALGFIQAAMKGGARNTDLAADALKELNLRARDVTNSGAQQAFTDLGLNAKQMAEQFAGGGNSAQAALVSTLTALKGVQDPAERSRLATALLGTQAEDLQGALMAVDPSQLTANLGQLDGAAQRLDDTVGNTAKGTLESWRRKAEMAFVNVLGGKVLPALQTAASWLMTKLGPAIDWVKDKWPAIAAAISTAWNTVIWPALRAFGEKVGVLLTTFIKPFAQWVSDNWPVISQTVADAFNNQIQPALQKVGDVLSWVWTNIFQPFVDWVNSHGPQISAVLTSMAKVVGTAFSWIGTAISTMWSVASAVINTFRATWAIVSGVLSAAARTVGSSFSAIGTAAQTAWNTLKSAWSGAVAWFTGLKDSITGALSGAGSWLLDAGKKIIGGLIQGIKNAISAVKETLSSLTNLIPSWKGPASRDAMLLHGAGQLIIGGLVRGLESRYGDVRSTLGDLTAEVNSTPLTIPGRGPGAVRGGDGASANGTWGAPGVQRVVEQHFNGLQEMSPRRLASYAALQAERAALG